MIQRDTGDRSNMPRDPRKENRGNTRPGAPRGHFHFNGHLRAKDICTTLAAVKMLTVGLGRP